MIKAENTVNKEETYFDYTVEGFNNAKDYLISAFGFSEYIINRMDSYEVVAKANTNKKYVSPVEGLLNELSNNNESYYTPSFHDYLDNPENKPYNYEIVKEKSDELSDEVIEKFQTYMLDEFYLEFSIDDLNSIAEFLKKELK